MQMCICVCVYNLASGLLVILWTGNTIPTATGAVVVRSTEIKMTAVLPAWLESVSVSESLSVVCN